MQKNLTHKAVVWSKYNCAACTTVKQLLKHHGYTVEERNIEDHPWTKQQLLEAVPNVRSVPQVFINDNYVGGLDNVRNYFDRIKKTTLG